MILPRGLIRKRTSTKQHHPHIKITSGTSTPMNKIQAELFWWFQTPWEDGQQLFLFQQPEVVLVLSWIVETEPQRQAMVSDYVSDLLVDLSIVCECLRQLGLFQPWANNFENQLVDKKEDIMKEFATKTASTAAGLRAMSEPSTIGRLGDSSDKKFEYPVDRRRNKGNTEAMILAESNLDAFWAVVDQLMKKHAGGLQGSSTAQLLKSNRQSRRTAPWVEPIKGNKSKSATNDLVQPLSRLFFSFGTSSSAAEKYVPIQPKDKRGAFERI
jgi:hypothetical protein